LNLETPISLAKRRPFTPIQLGVEEILKGPNIEFTQMTVEEITKHYRNFEGKFKNKDKFFERLGQALKNPQFAKGLSFKIGIHRYKQILADITAHNKKLYTDWREQLLKAFHQRYIKRNPSATKENLDKFDERVAKQFDNFFAAYKKFYRGIVSNRFDPSGLESQENIEFIDKVSTNPLKPNLSKVGEEDDLPIFEAGDERCVVYLDKDPIPPEERLTPKLKEEIANAIPLPLFNEAALQYPPNILWQFASAEQQTEMKAQLKKLIDTQNATKQTPKV